MCIIAMVFQASKLVYWPVLSHTSRMSPGTHNILCPTACLESARNREILTSPGEQTY